MTGNCGEPGTTPPPVPSSPQTPQFLPHLSAADVSRASGLREDLVVRFVPSVDTPNGPVYTARHVALARVVKTQIEVGTPASAVEATARELNSLPDNELHQSALTLQRANSTGRRRGLRAAVGIIAIGLLVIGGVVGGLLSHASSGTPPNLTTPTTVTVPGPTQSLQPAVPQAPDPVCAQWGPMTDSYIVKRADWVKTDSSIPASQWSPDQRAVTMGVIPVIRDQATDLRALAVKAVDPMLRALMQLQAQYDDAFADHLPTYNPPSDKPLWQAAIHTGDTINSLCHAVVPPR